MIKMKRIALIVLTALTTISVNARTTQPGIVQEYNEKAKKTPLAGVELNVRSANSSVSDKNGNFSLQFLTLKPGEKINVRRIEKLGYEVFNKEAIEQWNLNPNTPFVIVMCKSDRFKKIRDNYEKVSSESYARQLKKEEAALLKLKEQGKLKEAEYQKQLFELRENYENQLDNLENYVDRFSRIDLSELSAVEQEIIALVQDGNVEEAIRKYDDLKIIDKIKRYINNRGIIRDAQSKLKDIEISQTESIEALYAMADRQIETMALQGGLENFQKIASIYEEIANVDSTKFDWLIKTGNFIRDNIVDFSRAMKYYKLALNIAKVDSVSNFSDIMLVYKEIGSTWFMMEEMDEMKKCFLDFLNLSKKVKKENSPDIASAYTLLAIAYLYDDDYPHAEILFSNAMDIYRFLDWNPCRELAGCYVGKGRLYESLGKYEVAIENFNKALDILKDLFPEQYRDDESGYMEIESISYFSDDKELQKEYDILNDRLMQKFLVSSVMAEIFAPEIPCVKYMIEFLKTKRSCYEF